MSGVAAAIGGSAVLGAIGSSSAAGKQSAAMGQSLELQKQMFDYQRANEAPYQAAGVKALGGMEDPRFQKNFSMSDFTTSPGYRFSLEQGQNALNAQNAATGNSVSGAGMAALSQYNVGTANNEYQQAFNNYQSQLSNQYGRLSTLAAGGAGANQAMGAAANNFANKSSDLMVGGANAQAAAQMGQMNSIGQGLTGIAGYMNKPSASPYSGYQSMSDFSNSSSSNLQAPSGYLSGNSGGTSMGSFGT